jgi:ligand-binding sensor domain-containing protein
MKKTILIIILFFSAIQLLNGQNFRHIGLVDGLVQPSVMAICQDKIGRMWFGTREGINVYDGEYMSSFRGWIKESIETDSLWIGSNVSKILSDKYDNIYIDIDKNLVKYDLH